MNNQRRQALEDVSITLDEAIDLIVEIIDEEQDAYDIMLEGLQNSSRGDNMQVAIGGMEDIISQIEDVKQNISDMAKRK